MNASDLGSKDWWLVVRSMPHDEALVHLNDYKASLLVENNCQSQQNIAGAMIHKINSEIKRINRIMNNANWQKACRNILTPELFEAVQVEKSRLESGR